MKDYLRYLVASQHGLTMAEIALIVVVFGLIVAGALKGCEMMSRAGIINTVKQIEKIDSALMRFDKDYKAFPGDIADAPARIPGCDQACRPDSGIKGNRRVDSSPEDRQRPGMESVLVWRHLAHAGLLDFVNKKPKTPDVINSGDEVPRAKIGGALIIGYKAEKQKLAHATAKNPPNGHYIVISAKPDKPLHAQKKWPLTVEKLSALDEKLDDGNPNSGELLAGGSMACARTRKGDAAYATSVRRGCTLFYRVDK